MQYVLQNIIFFSYGSSKYIYPDEGVNENMYNHQTFQ